MSSLLGDMIKANRRNLELIFNHFGDDDFRHIYDVDPAAMRDITPRRAA